MNTHLRLLWCVQTCYASTTTRAKTVLEVEYDQKTMEQKKLKDACYGIYRLIMHLTYDSQSHTAYNDAA